MVDLAINNNNDILRVCNVYGPICYNHKDYSWDSLNSLGEFQNGIIVGDFNATISSKEIRGNSLVRNPFGGDFEDLIANLDLLDMKPKKGMYTWTN